MNSRTRSLVHTVAAASAVLGIGGAALVAALPADSVGRAQLKDDAVNGARVQDKTLTGKDIQSNTLGTVAKAKTAKSADTAKVADSAKVAGTAYTTANKAGGGVTATIPAAPTTFASLTVPAGSYVINAKAQIDTNSNQDIVGCDLVAGATTDSTFVQGPERRARQPGDRQQHRGDLRDRRLDRAQVREGFRGLGPGDLPDPPDRGERGHGRHPALTAWTRDQRETSSWHEQRGHPAEPAVEAHVGGVRVEHVPEGAVGRPRQRLVAGAPRGSERDPHGRPVGGAVPGPALLGDQPVAHLELGTPAVEAVGCRADRPDAEVEHHQLQLEVTQRTRLDQDGRDVLVRGTPHGTKR